MRDHTDPNWHDFYANLYGPNDNFIPPTYPELGD